MLKTPLIAKFLRYSSVGITVFLAQEAFLFVVQHTTELGPRRAFWVAWVPAILLHFLLTKFYTFRNRTQKIGRQVFRYLCAVGITSLVQYSIYHFALKTVSPQPNLALAVAAVLSTVLNFGIMKFAVFEPKATIERLRRAWRAAASGIKESREARAARM